MRISLFLILFYFAGGLLLSQNEKLLDAETLSKDIDEAYSLINSGKTTEGGELLERIMRDSETINYPEGIVRGAKGLMMLYTIQGDYERVISTGEAVEGRLEEAAIHGESASIILYKGMAYLNLGFLDLAKGEFNRASKAADKMEESDGKHYVKALIFDNMAGLHDQVRNNSDSVLFYTYLAIEEVENIDEYGKLVDAKHSQLAFQYSNLGEIYSERNEPENAENYFLKALSFYEDDRVLSQRDKIILFSELGGFYTKQKRFDEALNYLQSAVEMEKKTSLPEIRQEIYDYLSDYYQEAENPEKSREYRNLARSLTDSINRVNRTAVNENINRVIQKADSQKEEEKKQMTVLFLVLLGGLLILIVVAWLYREKHLRKRYNAIIEELKREEASNSLTDADSATAKAEEDKEDISTEESQWDQSELDISIKTTEDETADPLTSGITNKTYSQILKKLEKFEKSHRYIKSDVTLPFLINYVGSNSKYLSLVLKNEKDKSFNQYINDLRIDYLIRLLYTHSKYREYKIESLSEEIGFQSRSSFINSFKKKTGITPSYFIKKLKEELN